MYWVLDDLKERGKKGLNFFGKENHAATIVKCLPSTDELGIYEDSYIKGQAPPIMDCVAGTQDL